MPHLHAELDAPLPTELATGAGTALFVAGWGWSPDAEIDHLELVWDGAPQPLTAQKQPRLDPYNDLQQPRAYRSGFWGHVRIQPGASGPPAPERDVELRLRAHLPGGATVEAELARIRVTHDLPVAPAPAPKAATGTEPLIAICMATHNPPPQLLAAQLGSIRAQTHRNWICLISDDASRPESFAELRRQVGDDPRFTISRSPRRLGFYRNFERALTLVPEHTRFVALADQDDRWYPDKLATLLTEIADAPLIYSDARVVGPGGETRSETYWATRANNHTDLLSILVANSVTGAASLFPAGLLKDALPFPPAQFAHYHDHWLALTACARGEIRFVDRPLYDYVQHGGQALGHDRASRMPSLTDRLRRRRYVSPREQVRRWRLHYFVDLQRMLQFATILDMRLGDRMDRRKRHTLTHFLDVERSPREQLLMLARGLRELTGRRHETLGAEWLVFLTTVWRRLLDASVTDTPQQSHFRLDALPPQDLKPGPGTVHPDAAGPLASGVAGTVARLADKVAPLDLDIDPAAPARVNLLIPSIDLEHLFGGYIAKFNLALVLARRGHRVRIVCVDPVAPLPRDWRARLESFSGLDGLCGEVEIAFGRAGGPLPVNPDDRFIGTTWWTAHIAHVALNELGREGFLYLIQEYEPFTFPMGTHAALARGSYDLPHAALFSTELLRDYFAAHRIGVFSGGADGQPAASATFRNAITQVTPASGRELHNRDVKRLLFYARPEPHAARNLFELGLLALEQAARDGVFDEGAWELHGIGGVKEDRRLPLGSGHALELRRRLPQDGYAELLRRHDLGLALMYTPHPSLVPLEMAAAGLVTVTSSFENKTAAAMGAISSNLITALPTVDGVASAVAEAALRVGDIGARLRGSAVDWPVSWEQSLNREVLRFVEAALSGTVRS